VPPDPNPTANDESGSARPASLARQGEVDANDPTPATQSPRPASLARQGEVDANDPTPATQPPRPASFARQGEVDANDPTPATQPPRPASLARQGEVDANDPTPATQPPRPASLARQGEVDPASPSDPNAASHVSASLIARAAELIRAGRLVAFPTETVYGLGANALDCAAVRRIFEAKGRPSTSPLIVHVDSEEMARTLVTHWPDSAAKLAARHWPGPLTLVLPKAAKVPDEVTAGLPTVGIRMPAHPVALALIAAAGVPIAAPSANRFTELSPTSAEHVRTSLGDRVDLILDGGSTPVGIESTVVSLAVDPPVLFRPGMVTREEIESLIGPVCLPNEPSAGPHASPGLHPRHYSPGTPLFLVSGGRRPASGRGIHVSHLPGADVPMPSSAKQYAAILYATLHYLDQKSLDWIAVEIPPETGEWAGIRDRLRRASSL